MVKSMDIDVSRKELEHFKTALEAARVTPFHASAAAAIDRSVSQSMNVPFPGSRTR